MGEGAGFEASVSGEDSQGIDPGQGLPEQQNENTGGNPAWSGLLGSLPEGLHGVVRPYLEEWDKGVNNRFQKIHSDYEPLKAYQQFAEQGLTPEALMQAHSLFNLINEDPRRVYDQMGAAFGFNNPEQGRQEQSQGQNLDDFGFEETPDASQVDIENHPKIVEMREKLEQAEQYIQAQYQQELNKQVETELDGEIDSLYEKFNLDPNDDRPEQFAMGLALSGMSLEAGFQKYVELTQSILQNDPARTAQRILPASGGVPSSKVNPAELNRGETKSLLANMIKQANEQG